MPIVVVATQLRSEPGSGTRTLVALLEPADDIEVIGEAVDGAEVERARTDRPDVVLLDTRMPRPRRLEATRRITADPSLENVRMVMLTTFKIDEYGFESLNAGASGFCSRRRCGSSPAATRSSPPASPAD